MVTYVVLVVANIGGVILLDETITPGMLGGISLILVGIGVLNRVDRFFQKSQQFSGD